MTITKLNNVDIETVAALASACREDTEKAATQWSASVHWTGGFRSEATVRDFGPTSSDEPVALGGSDTAPNPVEQLLGALGNCLAVGYAANATAAGIEIQNLQIDLEGDLDLTTFLGLGDDNAGYSSIRATVHLDTDATPDAVEGLHRKVTSTSPVGHTLSRSVPLEVRLQR
jgi:uncharacterized OsmC-like protein